LFFSGLTFAAFNSSLTRKMAIGLPCFSSAADDADPAIKRAREVKRLRSDVVSELLKLAMDEADWSMWREDSIRMLGELKAQESVEPLLRILLTKGELRSETGPLSAYPAAQALAGMGSVIYREVWGKVARDPSDVDSDHGKCEYI
jgi:hypothetical protein